VLELIRHRNLPGVPASIGHLHVVDFLHLRLVDWHTTQLVDRAAVSNRRDSGQITSIHDVDVVHDVVVVIN